MSSLPRYPETASKAQEIVGSVVQNGSHLTQNSSYVLRRPIEEIIKPATPHHGRELMDIIVYDGKASGGWLVHADGIGAIEIRMPVESMKSSLEERLRAEGLVYRALVLASQWAEGTNFEGDMTNLRGYSKSHAVQESFRQEILYLAGLAGIERADAILGGSYTDRRIQRLIEGVLSGTFGYKRKKGVKRNALDFMADAKNGIMEFIANLRAKSGH